MYQHMFLSPCMQLSVYVYVNTHTHIYIYIHMHSSASHNRRANGDRSLGSSFSGSLMLDMSSLVGCWLVVGCLLAWLVGPVTGA